MSAMPEELRPAGLGVRDQILLYLALVFWVVVFIAGILVNSAPFRTELAAPLSLDFPGLVSNTVMVILTYTLTNVAILCILAGLLGTFGRRSQLGADSQKIFEKDTINPRSSAILRGFLVYLALIAGVLILGDDPAEPTQKQYIRLAGFISLLSFVVNAKPSLFGQFLRRMGDLFESDKGKAPAGQGSN